MTPRTYWQHYVNVCGGPAAAALRLGIPYPTIAAVCNGRRGIGHQLAARMCAADKTLDSGMLIWVRPLVTQKAA